MLEIFSNPWVVEIVQTAVTLAVGGGFLQFRNLQKARKFAHAVADFLDALDTPNQELQAKYDSSPISLLGPVFKYLLSGGK